VARVNARNSAPMRQLAINPLGMERWFGGDCAPLIPLIALAERKGIDQVTLSDHVVMGEQTEKYPYGTFPGPPSSPFPEPLTMLAAVAATTERIRLATGVVISPLRPAAFLAKQAATLDALSRGRLDLGVGTGWQREEYDACGVPWEHRLAHLDEQVRAMQLLWRVAPASFAGRFVRFERIHCFPRPVQAGGIPIVFGVAPTERNFARVAELGAGWTPMERDPLKLAPLIQALHRALEARGREARGFFVRASAVPVKRADGSPDLDATLERVSALWDVGVTMVTLNPAALCRGPEDYERLLERAVAHKH
jgi:probable F420-dependent oxidoreductase